MHDYIIVKYIRLSLDDVITESLSIPHQRLLLDRHIEALDIPNAKVLEFVDNGHSGTNMERPAVQEMLDLVRSGGVNCIVVKDFSRFSRNALESGYYIEQIFPLYQVRFISVSDNFDSNDYKDDTGGIDVAFKFLIHEYYSIDLSKKVKSAKRVKMRRGESIVANAIYGYRKNDLGKWEPDPEPAEIVRLIFRLALDGLSTAQIRDKLCAAKYPTPLEYIDMKRGKDIAPQCIWTARMVWHTLNNEQYTGSYVSGKQESKAVGSHSKIHTEKSAWIIIPDSHPPIVSKEDFTAAQELLTRYKSSTTAKPVNNPLQDDVNRPCRDRMISGERMANNPIYGYVKDGSGNLEIDPTAANIIQEMYQLAANGLSVKEIRDRLTDAVYPIPSEHIKLGRGYDVRPTCRWTDKCVRGILQNVQYTGAYVSGKILKNYETGKKYHTAQSDWIVIPDKNPVIVSKELFDAVQEIVAKSRGKRKIMCQRDYLLRGGILKCGCCGYAMIYDDSSQNIVYRCTHTLADPNADCHKLKVSATELDEAVLTLIRKQAEIVLNSKDISTFRKTSEVMQNFVECEKQLALCVEQRQRVYERFILREIDRETYLSLKDDCTVRIDRLNNQLAVLKQVEQSKRASIKSTVIAKDALRETADSRGIVEALIDKVYVLPDNQIEVNWKIADFA